MKIFFTSDLHDGHSNIGKFRFIPQEFIDAAEGDTSLANSLWLDAEWKKAGITKRDHVYILGDAAFNTEGLNRIGNRLGHKLLYPGNHDDLHATTLLKVFKNIRGCGKHPKLGWLSHFPVHPCELRDKFSLHGHVHMQTIPDYRYINLSCDSLFAETGSALITMAELIRIQEERLISKEVTY